MALQEATPQDSTRIIKPADATKGDVLIDATFAGVKHIVKDGKDLSLYLFDNEGEEVGIWGTAVLNSLMPKVADGCRTVITYHGLGKAAPGKNAPHQFKVQYEDGEEAPF